MVIKGGSRLRSQTETLSSHPTAGNDVPAGTMAVVRSFLVLRCDIANAIHTLIHQRQSAPSCEGHAPIAERTMDPARM